MLQVYPTFPEMIFSLATTDILQQNSTSSLGVCLQMQNPASSF